MERFVQLAQKEQDGGNVMHTGSTWKDGDKSSCKSRRKVGMPSDEAYEAVGEALRHP